MNTLSQKRRGPLTLLMTSRRVRWWVAFVVVLPGLYVASFGPASWIVSHTITGISAYRIFYRPVDALARSMPMYMPDVFCEAFEAYYGFLVPADKFVDVGAGNSIGPDIYILGGWPIDVDQVRGLPPATIPVGSFISPVTSSTFEMANGP